jgi:hypothetical protein
MIVRTRIVAVIEGTGPDVSADDFTVAAAPKVFADDPAHEVKQDAEQEQQQAQIERAQVMHSLLQEARRGHWSPEEKQHRGLMTASFDAIRNRQRVSRVAEPSQQPQSGAAAAAPMQPSDDVSKRKTLASGSSPL